MKIVLRPIGILVLTIKKRVNKETYNVTEYISYARSARTSPFTNLRLYCLCLAYYYRNTNFILQLFDKENALADNECNIRKSIISYSAENAI